MRSKTWEAWTVTNTLLRENGFAAVSPANSARENNHE